MGGSSASGDQLPQLNADVVDPKHRHFVAEPAFRGPSRQKDLLYLTLTQPRQVSLSACQRQCQALNPVRLVIILAF
jgi:hypothetical protein